MPDYKELYFALYRRVARITEQLIEAQREMEEQFLADEGAPPLALPTDRKPE